MRLPAIAVQDDLILVSNFADYKDCTQAMVPTNGQPHPTALSEKETDMNANPTRRLRAALCLVVVLSVAGTVHAQGVPRAGYAPTQGEPWGRGIATPALQYFGSQQKTFVQRPRQQMPAPQPLQLRGRKPFQSITRQPTLSPYLSLDALETIDSLPAYHTFVRPQIRQRQASLAQQMELRRLRQQVRSANATGIVSNNPSGGMPTTGHSSQFLNMGGYFPGAAR